jgi:hypothetical protein
MTVAYLPAGRPVTSKTVFPNNAYLVRWYLTRWNAATDAYEPWTGATVVASFTEDENGLVPIGTLSNIAMTAVGPSPGTYAAVVPGPDMAQLTPYLEETVYEFISDGNTGDLSIATPLVVRAPRYGQ